MTKDEKIKEAWGDAYETIKNMLGENGYIYTVDLAHSNLNMSSFGLDLTYNNIGVRPKSLVGIHKNNGWIKIESEDDLPNDEGIVDCYFRIDDITYFGFFEDNQFHALYDNSFDPCDVTHFQKMIHPKPPIY